MKRSDFLRRLIGITGFGLFNVQALIPKRKIYLQQFFVAGFKHYRGMQLLSHMQVNDLLELKREPENMHDLSAIALYWQQEKIGYVPAEQNEILAKLLDAQALPLLGMITHLKRDVKPWENVVAAIYFLQDDTIIIPPHADYLRQLQKPVYRTTKKEVKEELFDQLFENDNRIVDISSIQIPEIKKHLLQYYSDEKYTVTVNNKPYLHLFTDDIYTYMYNVNPIKWMKADDGEKYILFEFVEHF